VFLPSKDEKPRTPSTVQQSYSKIKQHVAESNTKEKKFHIEGHKEVPIFSEIETMLCSNTIEPMHGGFLGVALEFLDHWLNTKKYKGKQFCLKKRQREQFADSIATVKLPGIFENRITPLSKYKSMKAWELRVLLFYVLEYTVRDFLPKEYYENFMQFCTNYKMLHSKNANEKEMLEAGLKLKDEFVPKSEKLYGDSFYKMNIHNMGHAGWDRKEFGVPYSRSAFQFESFLGKIMRSVHGTNRIESHMIFISDMVQFLDIIYSSIEISDNAKGFISEINPNKFKKFQEKWIPVIGKNDMFMVGELKSKARIGKNSKYRYFSRFFKNGFMYYTKNDQITTFNSYTVQFNDGKLKEGEIQEIFEKTSKNNSENKLYYARITDIKEKKTKKISIDNIIQQLIMIEDRNKHKHTYEFVAPFGDTYC